MEEQKESCIDSSTANRSRNLIIATLAITAGYFVLGLGSSILGPSLVSMAIVLGVDTKTISWATMGRAVGHLCGTSLSGLIYARINKGFLFSLLFSAFGLSTVLCPLGGHIFYFAAILMAQGIAFGFVEGAGPCYLLTLWTGHKRQASIFQTIYTLWAIGTTTGPLILSPFLAPVGNHSDTNSSGSHNDTNYDARSVRYGYIITGSVAMIPTMLFAVAFALEGCPFLPKSKVLTSSVHQKTSRPSTLKLHQNIFKLTVALAFFSFTIVEGSISYFLATYSIKGLGWSNNEGSLVTSAYYGGNLSIKILCILVFVILKPRTVLYIASAVTFLACGLMNLSRLHNSVLWLSAVMAGMGIAAVPSSLFLWTEQYTPVTGRTSSVFLASCSVAGIVGPLSVGILIDHVGSGYIPFMFLFGGVCLCSTFVSSDLYVRHCYIRAVAKTERSWSSDVANHALRSDMTSGLSIGPIDTIEVCNGYKCMI